MAVRRCARDAEVKGITQAIADLSELIFLRKRGRGKLG
jgi:hypothetical protein